VVRDSPVPIYAEMALGYFAGLVRDIDNNRSLSDGTKRRQRHGKWPKPPRTFAQCYTKQPECCAHMMSASDRERARSCRFCGGLIMVFGADAAAISPSRTERGEIGPGILRPPRVGESVVARANLPR
jgi:hypothetical protein